VKINTTVFWHVTPCSFADLRTYQQHGVSPRWSLCMWILLYLKYKTGELEVKDWPDLWTRLYSLV